MQPEQKLSFHEFHDIKDKAQWGLLAEAIVICINQAFGHEMPEDEVASALTGTYAVISKDQSGQVVGYSTLHRKSAESFRHSQLRGYDSQAIRMSFGAGVVDKAYQGRGVYRELNKHRVNFVIANRAPLLTTQTQNPRVEHGITKALEAAVEVGQLESFSLQRVLLPAFYERRLTKDPLTTATGTAFENLNFEAGDAFALIFELTYPTQQAAAADAS